MPPAQHRRHRFTLNLEADTLAELVGVLHFLADEIEVEAQDSRRIRSRGSLSTYEALLRTDPEQHDERYREQLAEEWREREQGESHATAPCD